MALRTALEMAGSLWLFVILPKRPHKSPLISTDSCHVFLSHASEDDDFVALLRKKLEDHGINVWVDSRNLRGGDKLSPEIETAIRTARNFLVVISPNTINSDWVFDEIKIAEQVEKENPDYRAIPLMLPGIKPKALKRYFSEEPAGEIIETEVGKLDEQLPHILAALGHRAPDHDLPKADEIENKPMAELLLELSEPCLTTDNNGAEQLSARAELTYIPHDISKEREVKSRPFRFIAPIGKKEQEDIRWYLEQYLIWPVGSFRDRAEKTESQLAKWGKALFTTVLGQGVCREPLTAWQQSRNEVERRFSVQVDASTLDDNQEAMVKANEAASRLQSLPWELLHDDAYLSDGANPVRIRRRLPNYKQQVPSLTDLPIRILLLSPRPEEKDVGYIDHRASALPLVEAVESLGDLVQLKILSPPTLGALEKELQSARNAKTPYHVLHFDGHGIYDKQHGLGALCFENPNDANKLEGRRNELVHADKLAKLLKDFRIPLVFLEACQTAQSEESPNASVAASLLEKGVTSVVAMSHSVLVETAKRFVTEFYQALAKGQRVGTAMLAGQKELMRNTYRLPIQGAGDFHLQDWFVPILYQEQHDPQLFAWIPSEAAQKMQKQQRQTRLGRLPEPPEHTFIGRSHDLLKAERLLEQQSYVVIRGQGGAGKTTVAVELARWLVESRRFDRCAFVSVEEYTHDSAVVEVLLQQLVNANYNLAAEYGGDIEKALQAIQRTLENERTLIVIDNMESLLADATNKQAVLDMLAKLPEAKLLFTTREALPEPFHHKAGEIELGELSLNDAKSLVMQVMNNEGLSLRHDDAGNTPQEVDDLVQSVGCHARALVLLARELAQRGVTATTANVREIMSDLELRYPGQRENSLFASVEFSLQRLSSEVREQIGGLAVFHNGGHKVSIAYVLGVDSERVTEVIYDLVEVGLAKYIVECGHVHLDPALSAYLDLEGREEQLEIYQQRWREVMGQLVNFLYQKKFQDVKLAVQLTILNLENLMFYLQALVMDWQDGLLEAKEISQKVRNVEHLLTNLNHPQPMTQVIAWSESLVSGLEDQGFDLFQHECMTIERLLEKGETQIALQSAQSLLQQCQIAGEQAYSGQVYSLATANFILGKSLQKSGATEKALTHLQVSLQQLETLGDQGSGMISTIMSLKGNCFLDLGRLGDAATAYEKSIKRLEKLKDTRAAAIDKGQLATVRFNQKRYNDALQGYQEALELFQQLGELGSVAASLHLIGMTYKEIGNYDRAEQAYRQSLSIESQRGNKAGKSSTLNELGNLYDDWGRPEQAVDFYHQTADICAALGDLRYEGFVRSNLAKTLIKLQNYDEARDELLRGIECIKAFGHSAEPWKAWGVLRDLEQTSGNPQAAIKARQKAFDSYMEYRRAGGENHSTAGRLAIAASKAISQGEKEKIDHQVKQLLERDDLQEHKNFLYKLQAIISGKQDCTFFEDMSLGFDDEVELILLMESLA